MKFFSTFFSNYKNKFKRFFPLLIIFILGLTSLLWFKNDFLILYTDMDIPLLPKYNLYTSFFSLSINQQHIFPFYIFFAIFDYIGLKLHQIEKLWFLICYLLIGFSMFYLVKTIFKDEKNIISIVSSTFYMFNLYLLHIIQPPLILVYALAPLILGYFIKGLNFVDDRKKSNFYLILTCIATFFTTASIANPPLYSMMFILLSSYLIFFFLTNRKKIVKGFLYYFKFLFFYLILELPIIILLYFTYSSPIKKLMTGRELKIETFSWSHVRSSFLNIFRLIGHWGWFTDYSAKPWISYAPIYFSNNFLIISTYILTFLAFLALFLKPRDNRIRFFTILALVALFLSHGLHEPTTKLFSLFYKYIPFFWIYREPFAKFTLLIAFSYSILIGYSVDVLTNFIKDFLRKKLINKSISKKIKKILPFSFVLTVVIVIVITSYPLLTGNITPDSSGHIKIPDYWLDIYKFLRKEDSKLFWFPKVPIYRLYSWGFSGMSLIRYIAPLNSVNDYGSIFSYDNKIVEKLENEIGELDNDVISKLLSILNVKYIIQRNDISPIIDGTMHPDISREALENASYIEFYKKFGQLYVYENTINLPYIFPSQSFDYISGDIDNVEDYFSIQKNEDIYKTFFLSDSIEDKKGENLNIKDLENIYLYIKAKQPLKKYQAFYDDNNNTPDIMEIDKEYNINLGLKNLGTVEWPNESISPVFLSYHWYDIDSGEVVIYDGIRSKLPKSVKQNKEVNVETKILTPSEPGNYLLMYDLIDEGVAWFSEEKVVPLIKPVKIVSEIKDEVEPLIVEENILKKIYQDYPLFETELEEVFFPREGEYEIYINDIWENVVNSFLFKIDDGNWQKINNKELIKQDSKYMLGKITIDKGIHTIAFKNSNPISSSLKFKRGANNFLLFQKGQELRENLPKILYKKINPTKYLISVENAKDPFYLVQLENYDTYWSAKIEKNKIKEHEKIYGYANAWYINKKGNYNVVIEYAPQKYFYFSLFISLTFLIILLISLIYLKIKIKSLNREKT